MRIPLSLSIIIANYNYEAYVGNAIESALAVSCQKREVIVVDDGSTDNSLKIIERFEEHVKIVRQPNLGQTEAYRNGFAASSGDVVVFLDADDLLHPGLMTEVAAAWYDGVSKVQFQVQTIDSKGERIGGVHPQFHKLPSAQEVRRWALDTGAYPTPAGSGNAYARWFVAKVFEFQSAFSDRANDSFMLAAAPFLGDVVTVAKPMAFYRIHGKNLGAQAELDDTRFANEIVRAQKRYAFSMEVATDAKLIPGRFGLDRNLRFLCLRMTSLKLRPDLHPISNDAGVRVLFSMLSSLLYRQGFSVSERISLFGWGGIVFLAPAVVARRVASWRYAPQSRPKLISTLLGRLGVIRASQTR